MGEKKFVDKPNDHRKVSDNGILINPKNIEAFSRMVDGGALVPLKGSEDAKSSELPPDGEITSSSANAEKPESRSVGAAAKDFNKDQKKGGKKGQPARVKPEKTETQENAKTEEEITKELEGIKTREDVGSYLDSLKGSVKIGGRSYSLEDYIVPKAKRILSGFSWKSMEVESLGQKLNEIIEEEKESRKRVLAEKGLEQETKYKSILEQIQAQEAVIMSQINNGIYAKLKDASEIYILKALRHKAKISELPKEQRANIKESIEDANRRISAAVKAYQEKVAQNKKKPVEEFVKEYKDKFGVNLFDVEGNWIRIQDTPKNNKVIVSSGKKEDAKGETANVSIDRAVELLGHYTIVREESTSDKKPEIKEEKKEIAAASEPIAEERLEKITAEEILPLEGEAPGTEKIEIPTLREAEGVSEERLQGMREGINKLKSERDQLKMEMDEAEEVYLNKKNSNHEHLNNFLEILGIKGHFGLGQSDLEEEGLKKKYDGKARDYKEKLAELESLEKELEELSPEDGEAEESGEKIVAEVGKEIAALPEKERMNIGKKLNSLGFYIEGKKNRFFADMIGKIGNDLPGREKHITDRGFFARSLVSWGEVFKKDAEKAEKNMEEVKEGKSKKFSNAVLLTGNLVRYTRVAGDITSPFYKIGKLAMSPFRYWMMTAMALVKGIESMKEARLTDKKVIDKTRIQDIDKAAEAAWEIYHKAKGENDSVSREELEKVYEENIPKDLLRRLNQDPKNTDQSGIIQSIIRYDVRKLTEEISNKIDKIEQNKNLSDQEKKRQRERIFSKYSDYLKSFDRLVAQCGTVDALAMGAQYVKTGTKAVVWGVTAETLFLGMDMVVENRKQILEKIEEEIKDTDKLIEKGLKFIAGEVGIDINEVTEPHGNLLTIHKGEPGFPIDMSDGSTPGGAIEHAAKTIDLAEIKEGDLGIQKSISDYYGKHPGLVDKYNELYGGGKKFNAGQIAERLWDEYDDKRDLVHAGSQIHLSTDGMHIENVTGDENMGYLSEKEMPTDISHEAVPETVPEAVLEPTGPEEDIVPPTVAESGEHLANAAPDFEVPSGGTGEYIMDPEMVNNIDRLDLEVKNLTDQLEDLDDNILKVSSGQYESVNMWSNPETMLEEMTKQKQILEAGREELFTKTYSGHVGSLRKFFSGGDIDKWKGIEKMKAWDLLERRESIAHKFFNRVLESDAKSTTELKEQIAPERGEMVKDWTLRVGKIMRKLGITKFK